MPLIAALIVLLSAFNAFATGAPAPSRKSSSKSSSIQTVLGIGVGVVGEKQNNNQAFDFRFMPTLRGGVDFGPHEVLLELGGFQSESGASGVEMKRQHEQIDLWYRYLFLAGNSIGTPFGGIAIGAQRDEVQTDYFGQTSDDTGQYLAQFSVAGGYRFDVLKPFVFSGEVRLATSSNYNPRVLPSLLLGLGFIF